MTVAPSLNQGNETQDNPSRKKICEIYPPKLGKQDCPNYICHPRLEELSILDTPLQEADIEPYLQNLNWSESNLKNTIEPKHLLQGSSYKTLYDFHANTLNRKTQPRHSSTGFQLNKNTHPRVSSNIHYPCQISLSMFHYFILLNHANELITHIHGKKNYYCFIVNSILIHM